MSNIRNDQRYTTEYTAEDAVRAFSTSGVNPLTALEAKSAARRRAKKKAQMQKVPAPKPVQKAAPAKEVRKAPPAQPKKKPAPSQAAKPLPPKQQPAPKPKTAQPPKQPPKPAPAPRPAPAPKPKIDPLTALQAKAAARQKEKSKNLAKKPAPVPKTQKEQPVPTVKQEKPAQAPKQRKEQPAPKQNKPIPAPALKPEKPAPKWTEEQTVVFRAVQEEAPVAAVTKAVSAPAPEVKKAEPTPAPEVKKAEPVPAPEVKKAEPALAPKEEKADPVPATVAEEAVPVPVPASAPVPETADPVPTPKVEPSPEIPAKKTQETKAQTEPKSHKKRWIWIVAILIFCSVMAGTLTFLQLRKTKAANDFSSLIQQIQEAEASHSVPTTAPTAPTTEKEDSVEITQTEPTKPAVRTILPKYADLYLSNTEFFGWIRVDGTVIDYPVMRSTMDNEKYLYANFYGEYSYAGTPFADNQCNPDSDNIMIYAHNIKDGSMFAGLFAYEKESFWEEHPTIMYSDLYEDYEYEVLAAFYDRVYLKTDTCFKFYQFMNAENEEEFDYAVSQFKEKSIYDTGVDAQYGDQLITLVTCAYHVENGRFVVVARRK